MVHWANIVTRDLLFSQSWYIALLIQILNAVARTVSKEPFPDLLSDYMQFANPTLPVNART